MRIALIGAAGALGQEILVSLAENARTLGLDRSPPLLFDVGENVGESAEWIDGDDLEIEELSTDNLRGLEAALLAVPEKSVPAVLEKLRPLGILAIDASRSHRNNAPLFVAGLKSSPSAEKNVIALPSAEALMLARVLAPLSSVGIERLRVEVQRPASAAGHLGISELAESSARLLSGLEPDKPLLIHRLAFNQIPQTGAFSGADTEAERDLESELSLLLGQGGEGGLARATLKIATTFSWAPWFHGTFASLSLGFSQALSPEQARALLGKVPGVKVLDEPESSIYPMPSLAVGDEAVLVGRVREEPTEVHGLRLILTLDNLRASADNAVAALSAWAKEKELH